MSNIEFRCVEEKDIPNAFALIEEVFDECVAPDYSKEGIRTFKEDYIYNDKFISRFKNGKDVWSIRRG